MHAPADILSRRSLLWRRLRARAVVLTTSPDGTRAAHRPADIEAMADRLVKARASPAVLEALCDELRRHSPKASCLIDFVHAAELVRRQGIMPAQALSRSRVRYQGTDGVRGRVAADREGESPLAALVARGEFTPGVCELLAYALMEHLGRGGGALIAQDGRDAFGPEAGRYTEAAARGFLRHGCRVVDLGILPTPLVPVAMAKLRVRVAVVITASHNPADQNGIKFFVEGRKLLPEPADYAVSAYAFLAALEGMPAVSGKLATGEMNAAELMAECVKASLTKKDMDSLRRVRFVVDAAHGAFSPSAGKVLASLGLDAEVINADMTGENINRDSGVAYLEGRERVLGSEMKGEIEIVRKVRETARASKAPVFGIALDGDGDRGFLLVYDAGADEVRIVDGDRVAYLLARCAKETAGRVFAGTVESDLAVFKAVEDLGIETAMTPVGDKWLSAKPKLTARLLFGEESSGHIVWPVAIGASVVVTGNGLLTGLCGAAAAVRLGLSSAQIAEPYAPGVVKTFYTYFVERAMLHRGSPVWRAVEDIANAALERLNTAGTLPADCDIREMIAADDRDMLYLRIERGREVLGAVFARNSGTENKTATYARGLREFEQGLVAMARAVNANHIRTMRDERLPEARAGVALVAALRVAGSLALSDARKVASREGVEDEARFFALMLALTKEGLIRRTGEELQLVEGS